jgi:DNA-binding response OmpR family regulator
MNKSILVVDDDRQLRSMLKRILEREGYDVAEAADGYAALQQASAQDYDLVITDIIMPHKEGFETILELRCKNPGIKIIAMSGGGRMMDGNCLELARNCGANFTIAKPFEPAAVRKLVRLCLATEE